MSIKKKRYGLLTFAHGTFYGLQLLQHEVDANFVSNSNRRIDQGITYDNIQSDVDIDAEDGDINIDNNQTNPKNACKKCTYLLICAYCPSFRPFLFCIIGLFQITPQAIMLFYGKSVYKLAIISLIPYLLTTLTAIFYYFKFLYYFAYVHEYKFTLLDDISFAEFRSNDTITQCQGTVPLVIKNTTDHEMDPINDNKSESESESYKNSTFMQITSVNVDAYSHKFFTTLICFMGMLLLVNVNVGIFTFVDVLVYHQDNDMVASVVFIAFAYPFIAGNMIFIELQLMNELLHDTKLGSTTNINQSHKLLSSNSSFFYLFGFVLNHFPVLYFMIKTAAFMSCFSESLYSQLGEERRNNSWAADIFAIASLWIMLFVFWYEPHFVNVMLNGYYNLYPPINNPNIENVTPPNKPCPNQTLEKSKTVLIAIVEFFTPYSWIIECCLTAINAIGLLLYFLIWDRFISSTPQYDYSGAGLPFIIISVIQIIVIIYAIFGEKCCYSIGDEYICNRFMCCKREICCACDCFFKCRKCCKCAPEYWYCWCCCCGCFFCCSPLLTLSPDYKFRFLTFLESLSLVLKLLHYYNYSTLNNSWYDVGFMILIFLSLITLFLMGFAGAFRSVHGLEIQSIMKSPALFTLCYLLGFAWTQFVVYGNFIFTMTYKDIERLNNNNKDYLSLIFMVFIWLVVSNLYTKEYRAFTKQIERDWFKYKDIPLIGWDRQHSLPPMIGNLFHFLQLMIVFAAIVVVYYVIELSNIDKNNPNWKFEKNLATTNLVLTFIILIISIIAVWSMSLAPETLKKMHQTKIKKQPTMILRGPTIYHDL